MSRDFELIPGKSSIERTIFFEYVFAILDMLEIIFQYLSVILEIVIPNTLCHPRNTGYGFLIFPYDPIPKGS